MGERKQAQITAGIAKNFRSLKNTEGFGRKESLYPCQKIELSPFLKSIRKSSKIFWSGRFPFTSVQECFEVTWKI